MSEAASVASPDVSVADELAKAARQADRQLQEFNGKLESDAAAELGDGRKKALALLNRGEAPKQQKPDPARGRARDVQNFETGPRDAVDGEEPPAHRDERKIEQKDKSKGQPSEKLDAAKARLNAALDGLTEDERDAVLGATSEAFATLTGKRQQAQRREAQLRADREAFNGEKTSFTEAKGEFDELLIEAKANPRKCLEAFGWTIDDAVHFETTDGEEPLERRLKRLEGGLSDKVEKKLLELEEQKKALADAQGRHAIDVYEGTIRKVISEANQDELEFVFGYDEDGERSFSDEEILDAVRHIQHTAWTESGKKKTVAASHALRYLNDQLRSQRRRLAGRKQPPERNGSRQREDYEAERPRFLEEREVSVRSQGSDDDEPPYGSPEWRERALSMLRTRS